MKNLPLCAAIVLLVSILTLSYINPHTPPTPQTLLVPPNTKVIGYFWNDEDVYIIYRPMAADESPENWNAPNSSVMSMDVPNVIIHETRLPTTPASNSHRTKE
jgi:hypothetical protein